MTRMRILLALLVIVSSAWAGLAANRWLNAPSPGRVIGAAVSDDGDVTLSLLSARYDIDRIYPSMTGPHSVESDVALTDIAGGKSGALLYATGVDVTIVGADGESKTSQDFFCHSNVTLEGGSQHPSRRDGVDITLSQDDRLFTLVPGRLSIHLPEGFGLPVWSSERINNFTMSLNLNELPRTQRIRMRTDVHYAAADRASEMRPLFRRALYAYEPMSEQPKFPMCHTTGGSQSACGPARGVNATPGAFLNTLGKEHTVHWLVGPGEWESRIDVTEQLGIDEPTTLHYATGHLHPFGVSLALVDKTTGAALVTIHSRDHADRLGVAHMSEFASTEGVALHPGHKYELVTKYHNTTEQPIDAMSIFYVYALDTKFERAHQTKLTAR